MENGCLIEQSPASNKNPPWPEQLRTIKLKPFSASLPEDESNDSP
jgi:hypothetical protein